MHTFPPAYPYTSTEVVCVLGKKEDETVDEGEHLEGEKQGSTWHQGVRREGRPEKGEKRQSGKASEITWTDFDIQSRVSFAQNWSEKMQFLTYLHEKPCVKVGKGWKEAGEDTFCPGT